MEKKYFTIKEAAKIIGVTPLTLRNWDKNGKFRASRHPINNYRIYKKEKVDKLLKEIEGGVTTRLKVNKVKKIEVKFVK